MKTWRWIAVAVAGTVAAPALADRIDLIVFENADGADVSALDLWVDVVGAGSAVDLVFHNDSGMQSFVRSVYIESTAFSVAAMIDGELLSPQPAGVKFKQGATPPNPAGSIAGFGGAWGGNLFSAKADKPGTNKDGIDPGESLTVRFDLADAGIGDVLDALRSDPLGFRIAAHVQGLPCGESVWAVNVPRAVPIPTASAMGLVGLGVMALRRRRSPDSRRVCVDQ